MRVAVAQIVSSTDKAANLALVERHTRQAAEAGAALVVFPEATMASFATSSRRAAEPLDGPWATRVREIAAGAGIGIIAGMFETSGHEQPYNTLLATGPGVVEAAYRKLHMYDAWGFTESDHILPGASPVTVDFAGVRLGLATCYDVRFPALFQHYGRDGADVVVLPASWAGGPGKADQFVTLCRARAMDSTCFVVAAAQADPSTVGAEVKPGSPTGVGHSVVVDPYGKTLAEAGEGPELLVVDLDVALVEKARKQVPVLINARFSSELRT